MNPSMEPRQKKQKTRAKPLNSLLCYPYGLTWIIAIPQFDGTLDTIQDIGLENENKSEIKNIAQVEEENLDASLDEDEAIPETKNTILCQFQKVFPFSIILQLQISRIKQKRKCILLNGVMNLNGKDFVFSKANGECEF